MKKPEKINNKVPILTADEAVALIPNEAVIYLDGSGNGEREPASLYHALAKRHKETGSPNGLTLIHPNGVGDRTAGSDVGFGVLALPTMIKRLLSGHLGQSPKLADLVDHNEVEAYNFSMGTLSQMMRAAAAKQPGVFTKVGKGTFMDPRQTGGKLNERTKEDLVKVVDVEGEEYLFYRTVSPTVALLRGTTSDMNGYITVEEEVGPAFLDDIAVAQAVHNNGGLVVVQVRRLVKEGTLNPKHVRIPGILVDAVVVDPYQSQSYALKGQPIDNFAAGDLKKPEDGVPPHPLTERKVIVRRSLMEAKPGDIGNIGVGVQTAISGVANEEGIQKDFTLTVETGVIGGASGPSKGKSNGGEYYNVRAVIPMADSFNFYEGGGLDVAYLSFAQVDNEGNVNVHWFNHKIMGTGGFIHISANAKKVVFGGTMTSGGFKSKVGGGKIEILQEGRFKKFVGKVDQITFSAKEANRVNKPVFYVTERCVFRLTPEGLELIEIAPGIDLEKDILPVMDFKPIISKNLNMMDERFFHDRPMGIKEEWRAKK
ncbi:acyl CoA:acetate/3-ketoacid CoA transferase [Candidatus Formimonas warabiya]|uniref:Acetate CoA-transferase YdiF n=1 Tax=Formimonas warabiya TaxID=1761012 RepID=A0A3G1KNL4_FORW1|nr:CoA-transferase [Candidatus Formimonas warabiya]ATW24010.1 acetate CoA-transferase YdiF [Candidatus Formimonas warabiya]